MSFDKIFDLTAGVYSYFYNNSIPTNFLALLVATVLTKWHSENRGRYPPR